MNETPQDSDFQSKAKRFAREGRSTRRSERGNGGAFTRSSRVFDTEESVTAMRETREARGREEEGEGHPGVVWTTGGESTHQFSNPLGISMSSAHRSERRDTGIRDDKPSAAGQSWSAWQQTADSAAGGSSTAPQNYISEAEFDELTASCDDEKKAYLRRDYISFGILPPDSLQEIENVQKTEADLRRDYIASGILPPDNVEDIEHVQKKTEADFRPENNQSDTSPPINRRQIVRIQPEAYPPTLVASRRRQQSDAPVRMRPHRRLRSSLSHMILSEELTDEPEEMVQDSSSSSTIAKRSVPSEGVKTSSATAARTGDEAKKIKHA